MQQADTKAKERTLMYSVGVAFHGATFDPKESAIYIYLLEMGAPQNDVSGSVSRIVNICLGMRLSNIAKRH